MSNQDNQHAFTADEATRIIVAAIEAKAITFPFLTAFNSSSEFFRALTNADSDNLGLNASRAIETARLNGVCAKAGYVAKMDAAYLLSLRETLINGLSEEDAKTIAAAGACSLV